ncbi:MAG: site-specific integrase [Tepidisphaeraceae bacterium]|jgi:integrase
MATTTALRIAGESRKALPRKIKFTVKALAAIMPPADPAGRLWVYDSEKRGLAMLVTVNDARSFYLNRRIHGKPSRVRLGGKEMTIEQARAEVDRLNGEIVGGVDPAERRRQERKAGTLAELWTSYRDEHLKTRCSAQTLRCDENRYQTCLDAWKSRRVVSITEGDVRGLHAKLGADRGHVTANRVVQLLRRMFNWARLPNPAEKKAVDMFRETSRERFVQPDEFPKLFKALDDEQTSPLMRDFVYLALWTGARRSSVASMRDEEINLAAATWTIPAPKSKNAKAITIPLAPPALEIIKRRIGDPSGFMLPSSSKSGHLENPKHTWQKVLERAGLKDITIHDLRRTLGSWQAGLGASLPIIGRSLGHRDPAATAIYSRVNLDPVRQSVNAATAAMLATAKPGRKGKRK